MCFIDDDEGVCEVWSEREVTARKLYKCSCCSAPIEPGQRYLCHFSVYEGDPNQEKMCLTCRDARKVFSADPNHRLIPNPRSFDDFLEMCISEGDEDSQTKWQPMLDGIKQRRRAARAAREVVHG